MAIESVGVVANADKPNTRDIIRRILLSGERLGFSVVIEAEVADALGCRSLGVASEELSKRAELIVACGGDGTILRAARITMGAPRPILGVNLGRLGFLAEASPEKLEQALEEINRGDFVTEPRMTLTATVVGTGETVHALNDITIAKSNQSRIISLEMREAGNWVNTYIGDGLILATPTGSTGYALAAGGPIVKPLAELIVAAPICPHSLTVRPIVFPDDAVLDIRVAGAAESVILLTADGQPTVPLPSGEEVRVRRGAKDVQLVRLASSSYYDTLRQKLHWGLDKNLR